MKRASGKRNLGRLGVARFSGFSLPVFSIGILVGFYPQESRAESPGSQQEETTASLTPGNIPESNLGDTTLPDNPNAIDHCLAKVRVDAANLRESPSLTAPIKGVRLLDESLFVRKMRGKWAQVVTEQGDTAYVAAYLLTFSWHDLLDQWKKGSPPPTVGKKAKVKWASVNVRPYPSTRGGKLGLLKSGDWIATLGEADKGWVLVQARDAIGFVKAEALQALPKAPPAYAALPLATLRMRRANPMEIQRESPSEYLARTAWSPELFQAHWPNLRDRAIVEARVAWERAGRDDWAERRMAASVSLDRSVAIR